MTAWLGTGNTRGRRARWLQCARRPLKSGRGGTLHVSWDKQVMIAPLMRNE